MQIDNPYDGSYSISDSNFNFLLRKAEDHRELKKNLQKQIEINYDLESQLERITTIILARKTRPIELRYYDIQTILGLDSFDFVPGKE